MDRVRHPYRVQIALIGLYGVTGLIATILVWVLKGPDPGGMALIMSAPYILGLLALPWLSRMGRRPMERVPLLLAGEGQLAHWTYSPEEWRRYTLSELVITIRKSGAILLLIYAVLFGFTAILATITTGRMDPVAVEAALVAATLFAVPTVFGLVVAGLSRYSYDTRHPGDVWIGRTGVWMSGRWYTWAEKRAVLRAMRFVHEPPRQLHFVIEWFRSGQQPGFWYSVRVPVPAGEEERATWIYGRMTTGAQPEGIARHILVGRLRELDFFDLVDPAEREGVLQRAEASGVLFTPAVKRSVHFSRPRRRGRKSAIW